MSKLIDISKYEVLSFQNKSQDFVDGVQWILEQMDKEPTIKAIPLEKLEQIRTEINHTYEQEKEIDTKWAAGLKYSLKIIDKAMSEVSE